MNVFRFLSELSAYQNKYVGMLAHLCTVHIRGVFIASSHSLSLLDFRDIHLQRADSSCQMEICVTFQF